jgi:hypothetical protein
MFVISIWYKAVEQDVKISFGSKFQDPIWIVTNTAPILKCRISSVSIDRNLWTINYTIISKRISFLSLFGKLSPIVRFLIWVSRRL